MMIRKFEEHHYENQDSVVFIKDDKDNKIEILLSTDELYYHGVVKENGVKIAETWNDTIKIYSNFGCAKIEAEMSFYYELHLDDEDGGEAAQEAFDAAVDAARDWLYT